jgi:hypothetical protein
MTVSNSNPASARREFISGPILLQVSKICTPVVMGVLFFVVLTPIAAVLRFMGRDLLRLRSAPAAPSYWLARAAPGGRRIPMTKQS